MPYNPETPIVEDETIETEKTTSSKVDRLLDIFESLDREEQLMAFDKISLIVVPLEESEDTGPDVIEGLPMLEEDETSNRFNAMQDKLEDF